MTDEKTRVVIMGCGGSGGVPYAGNVWGKCDPNNSKNHRTRPSVYIAKGDTRIVIDTTPEFRQQINATGHTGPLNAVLYTHAHADHIMGIDDLRAIWHQGGKTQIPVYGSAETLKELTKRFDYVFETKNSLYPARLKACELPSKFMIGGLKIQSFDQLHSHIPTKGFRIGDFGYSTDVSNMPQDSLDMLKGIKVWVVGAHTEDLTVEGHAGLNTIKEWVDYIKPEITYLTHLNALGDYDDLCKRLPSHIRPAYDGLEFFIDG